MSSDTMSSLRPVVVGVDGSEPSRAALRWGAEEARLRGLPLEAVITWEFPNTDGWDYPDLDLDLGEDAKKMIDETITSVLGETPDAPVTATVIHGHAALVLVERSEEAALVVVGSRGHGGFAGLLLGSVSEHLAAHARCPVAIIHVPKDRHQEKR
ncbi:MAG TPA: universal stress protein [Acidimicrobiales bacterium]|nr:universal stress protein [Acidimicrobiales bacterium]